MSDNHVNENMNDENIEINADTKSHAARIAEQMNRSTRPRTNNTEEQASEDDLIVKYEKQIAELKDQVLRSAAECENVRRRAKEEVDKANNFAIAEFSKNLVNVLEHLFRASDSISEELATSDENYKNIKVGIDMTKQEFINVFEKFNIKRVYPKGEKFDHNFHQAISQLATNEHEDGTVIDVIQAGYVLKERLLRPALVVVAKNS